MKLKDEELDVLRAVIQKTGERRIHLSDAWRYLKDAGYSPRPWGYFENDLISSGCITNISTLSRKGREISYIPPRRGGAPENAN